MAAPNFPENIITTKQNRVPVSKAEEGKMAVADQYYFATFGKCH